MPDNGQGGLNRVQAEPGRASAEGGFVVLDGPDGLALTMTPSAAMRTAQSLIDAAQTARTQVDHPFDPGAFGQDES